MTYRNWPARDEQIIEAVLSEDRHTMIQWFSQQSLQVVWPGCPVAGWALIWAAVLFIRNTRVPDDVLEACRRSLAERHIEVTPRGLVIHPSKGQLTFPPNLDLV